MYGTMRTEQTYIRSLNVSYLSHNCIVQIVLQVGNLRSEVRPTGRSKVPQYFSERAFNEGVNVIEHRTQNMHVLDSETADIRDLGRSLTAL